MKISKVLSYGVALGLIAFQNSSALAAEMPTVAAAPNPEISLLGSMLSLQAQKLTADQYQSAAADLIVEYSNTASPDGRYDRLENAFVALNIYTPPQAHQVVVEIQNTQTQFQAQANASEEKKEQLMTSEMENLMALQPNGAQFSMCAAGYLVDIGIWSGAIALIVDAVRVSKIPNSGTETEALTIGGFVAGITAFVVLPSVFDGICD